MANRAPQSTTPWGGRHPPSATRPSQQQDMAASQPMLWARRTAAIFSINDCACEGVLAAPRIDRDALPMTGLPILEANPETLVIPLHPGYWLLFAPTAPQGPVVLNDEGYRRWQAFARQPQPPSQPFDWNLWQAALLWPSGQMPPPPQEHPRGLTAWLAVTQACNLACPMCYVSKRARVMPLAVAEAALQRLTQQARAQGWRRLKLKYAGGEPTLAWRRLQQIHARAVALAQASGLDLEAVLLTNGTRLTAERVAWLQAQGLRVALSLDGVGTVHDRLRPARDGQSAFQRLAHAVDTLLLPAGIRPSITITVSRWNAGHVAETLAWVLERDLPFSINFYRQPWNTTAPADLQLEEEAILAGMRDAFRVLEDLLPTWPFIDGLLDRGTGLPHSYACGVGRSYLVITPEGQVAPCHMRQDTTLGSVTTFTLEDLQHSPIPAVSVDDKPDCRTCPFRYLCAGGCPLETYRQHGRWDQRNPNCAIYRALYPEVLRLEGLRLLKVHGLT